MIRILQRGNRLIIALMLAVSSVYSLLTPHLVNAVSAYDDVIQTTNSATVKKDSTTIDISSSWASVLADCDNNWYDDSVSSYAISCSQFNTNLQTALTNGTGWFVSVDEAKTSYSIGGVSTFAPGDKYVKVGVNTNASNYGEFSGTGADARLNMKGSGFTNTCVASIYVQTNYNSRNHSNAQLTKPHVLGVRCDNGNDTFNSAAESHDETLYDRYTYIFNSDMPDVSGYAGLPVHGNADADGDGLSLARESTQGTSDNSTDTDGDGLNDLIESRWYPDRDEVFCGSSECAYPNPIKKDLYVEVDWMIDGSRIYKPTSTQLSLVKDAYAAHDIQAHFDTGQYGGGNQLPSYTSNLRMTVDSSGIDFYDYRDGTSTLTANFSSNRDHIWHYMVSGYEWNDGDSNNHDDEGSSGATYVSYGDTFISTGRIEDNPNNGYTYSSVDNAIAGTIIHELGHSLCLSGTTADSLRSECYYQYVDSNTAPSTYDSVMNYSYQMSDLLDYSDGSHNSTGNDHNDWGAIGLGFADFANINQGDEAASGRGGLIVGVTSKQAKQLRNEHRIFGHVDKTKRSIKRQMFDIKKNLTINR